MKTITTAKLFTSTFILSFFILLFSCSKDDGASESPSGTNGDEMSDDTGDTDSTDTVSINLENSVVQKGPFLEGSTITIVELNDNLESTNVSYTTETIDDFGSFSFTRELSTNYVDVITTGFYFNEVTGEPSSGQVTLRNFVDASSSASANINILTTLARPRIKYLIVNEEKSYAEAKAQAEQEVLASFNIPESAMAGALDFEALDISKSGEGNAILLAVSSVIQGENNTGELSELITKFANDLEDNGAVEDRFVLDKIAEGAASVDTTSIRQNLEERFGSLNVDFDISDFGYFIDTDGNGLVNGEDVTPIGPQYLTDITLPLFSWHASSNLENTYDLQVSDTEDFSNLLLDVSELRAEVTQNDFVVGVFQSDVLLERGQNYYWRIRMVTEEGTREWKNAAFEIPEQGIFGIGILEGAIPIGDDALVAFSSYTQNSKPTYFWERIPLDGVQYEAEIASDSDFQDILFNSGLLSENITMLDYVLPNEGEYYMRVRYIEANGVVSEWSTSDPLTFQLPLIGYNQFIDNCQLDPHIEWQSTFAEIDASLFSYDVQVALDMEFSEPIINEENVEAALMSIDQGGQAIFRYNLDDELPEEWYYYRVRIRDENDIVGEWETNGVYISGLSPIHLDMQSPYEYISVAQPILDWYPPDEMNCEIEEVYELQLAVDVGRDENFNPIFSELLLDVGELTETSYQVSFNLEAGNVYHYRVRYHDGQGNYSDWVATSFKYDLPALEIPDFSPQGPIDETNPLITWTVPRFGGEQVPTEVRYDLQLSADFNFSDVLIDVQDLEELQYQIDLNLERGAEYHYRVRYSDEYGNFSEWLQLSFTINP